jgi:hypothetical protein
MSKRAALSDGEGRIYQIGKAGIWSSRTHEKETHPPPQGGVGNGIDFHSCNFN